MSTPAYEQYNPSECPWCNNVYPTPRSRDGHLSGCSDRPQTVTARDLEDTEP